MQLRLYMSSCHEELACFRVDVSSALDYVHHCIQRDLPVATRHAYLLKFIEYCFGKIDEIAYLLIIT